MQPYKINNDDGNLFSPRLSRFLNPKHELLFLGNSIDWDGIEKEFSGLFTDFKGQPPKPVRLILGLLMLQYIHNLSDEAVVERWVENPYWQSFCGYDYLQWEAPIHPSSLTRWRQRLGKESLEKILSYTVHLAVGTKTVKKKSVEKVNVDITVAPKNVTYPTDSKLYFKALLKLVKKAKQENICLRQSYTRSAKKVYFKVNCYAKARQMKRLNKEQKRLKIFLGRVYRDVLRKTKKSSSCGGLLPLIERLLNQKRKDKNKLYSLHETHVECIAKGKAHKRYEFGCKASFVATHKDGLVLDAQACHGNPYDGHTLKEALKRAEKNSHKKIKEAFVDKGYRGHGVKDTTVYVSGQKRGVNRRIRKDLKRRQAIEPMFGHMKNEGKLERNFLKGIPGDEANILLCGIGHNLKMILKKLKLFFVFFRFWTEKKEKIFSQNIFCIC